MIQFNPLGALAVSMVIGFGVPAIVVAGNDPPDRTGAYARQHLSATNHVQPRQARNSRRDKQVRDHRARTRVPNHRGRQPGLKPHGPKQVSGDRAPKQANRRGAPERVQQHGARTSQHPPVSGHRARQYIRKSVPNHHAPRHRDQYHQRPQVKVRRHSGTYYPHGHPWHVHDPRCQVVKRHVDFHAPVWHIQHYRHPYSTSQATLYIVVSPHRGELFIDGAYLGPVGRFHAGTIEFPVAPGYHEVRLSVDGRTYIKSMHVRAGALAAIRVRLSL